MWTVTRAIQDCCRWIFFTQPLRRNQHRGLKYYHLARFYTYATLCVGFFHITPWIMHGSWHLLATSGCNWDRSRIYLEAICIQPYRQPGKETHWYLDLWTPTLDTSDQEFPSAPTEMVMTGYLPICDASSALQDQIAKIKNMSLGLSTVELLDSLQLTTRVTSSLCPVMESFSVSYCAERDKMNQAFRAWVEAYAMTVTRSNFIDLPYAQLIFFPFWSITLRFLNSWLLHPWLPEPALYSFQVKAEIRYQTRIFIEQSIQALDRIDARFPLLASSSNPTIEAAITTAENYRQYLTSIRESHLPSSLWVRCFHRKPETLVIVEEQIALTDRIRTHLQAAWNTLQVYGRHSARLRSQLQDLRKDFNPPEFEFSPTGLVAVPASLLDQVQHSPFEWHEDEEGGESARHLLTPHSHVYFYDLDNDDGSRPAELRLAVASLCRSRKNADILSGALYMICTIWAHAATMSELDKNTLGSVQRSWVVERLEAVHRYELQTGMDYMSTINMMLETYRNYEQGKPVPPSL